MKKYLILVILFISSAAFAQNQGLIVPPSSVGTAPVGQVPGASTNDNAAAGKVGEYVTSTVLIGAAVALTNNTAADVTSISLTAGDWDVWGTVITAPNAATLQTLVVGWINTVSATAPTPPAGGIHAVSDSYAAGSSVYTLSLPIRISLSSTTTVYLSALSLFTVNTNAAYGIIHARRAR